MRMSFDFDYILRRVFDLFVIKYQDIDYDSFLMYKKMNYFFMDMPPINEKECEEKERIIFEIEALKLANSNFMDYIREPGNIFDEMHKGKSPLKHENFEFGVPKEYF